MSAAKKIILLLWLVILASLGNASALTPGTTETCVGEKTFETLATRQAEPLETAGRHQENGSRSYEVAPDSLLAAETETFYRTMSQADFAQLKTTGSIPATSETFISPSLEYASEYEGVTVQFNVNSGTTDSLLGIGVRNAGLTQDPYGALSLVQSGWTADSAFFKLEGGVVNVGLGQGSALQLFNNNIINFAEVPK